MELKRKPNAIIPIQLNYLYKINFWNKVLKNRSMMHTRLHFIQFPFPRQQQVRFHTFPVQQPEIGNFILEVNLQLGGRTTKFYNEYWGWGALRNYGITGRCGPDTGNNQSRLHQKRIAMLLEFSVGQNCVGVWVAFLCLLPFVDVYFGLRRCSRFDFLWMLFLHLQMMKACLVLLFSYSVDD